MIYECSCLCLYVNKNEWCWRPSPLTGYRMRNKNIFLNNRTNVWARTFWNISPGCRHARWWLRLCGSVFCVWESQHIWCVHIFHQFVWVTHINPCPKGLVERFKLGFLYTALITVYWNKRNCPGFCRGWVLITQIKHTATKPPESVSTNQRANLNTLSRTCRSTTGSNFSKLVQECHRVNLYYSWFQQNFANIFIEHVEVSINPTSCALRQPQVVTANLINYVSCKHTFENEWKVLLLSHSNCVKSRCRHIVTIALVYCESNARTILELGN